MTQQVHGARTRRINFYEQYFRRQSAGAPLVVKGEGLLEWRRNVKRWLTANVKWSRYIFTNVPHCYKESVFLLPSGDVKKTSLYCADRKTVDPSLWRSIFFFISICISTLPTQLTTYVSRSEVEEYCEINVVCCVDRCWDRNQRLGVRLLI